MTSHIFCMSVSKESGLLRAEERQKVEMERWRWKGRNEGVEMEGWKVEMEGWRGGDGGVDGWRWRGGWVEMEGWMGGDGEVEVEG